MDTYRHLQLGVSVFLLANTIFLYTNMPDFWLYGWLSGAAAVLNLINRPACYYWRLASAAIIVLGVLETLFLSWSVRHVEQAALIENTHSIVEGRNILLAAIATTLTVSTRIRSANHDGFLHCLRTVLLVVSLAGLVPALGYSTCFYVRGLPYCHAFH